VEHVTVSLELEAPIEDIWAALMDIEQFPTYMSSVEQIRILESDADTRTAEWSVLLRGSILKWTERATIHPERHQMEFVQIDGDLSVFEGCWRLDDLCPGRTRAELAVSFEIGVPLLARMLNPIARESLHDNTEEMLRAMERRSNGAPADSAR
jgi:ribosome-associated toxin RatA of RatAB toxin-antitoxin module